MQRSDKIEAFSKARWRATASERRAYGGSTVTEFWVHRASDKHDASKWKVIKGYGKTPQERKADAIRRFEQAEAGGEGGAA